MKEIMASYKDFVEFSTLLIYVLNVELEVMFMLE